MTSASAQWYAGFGGRDSPIHWGIAQLEIQKEACANDTMSCALLNQWREREMDWGLCWERTAGARKWVEDAKGAVQPELDNITHAEIACLTSRDHDKTFEEMLVAIGDSLSDLASSDYGVDEQDEDDIVTEHGKLSEDDEPGWLIGTITNTAQQRMERIRQKQMKLDALTQPGWEDAADQFRKQHKMSGTSQLRVSAVVPPQMNDHALAPPLTTNVALTVRLDIVLRILQKTQGTSRPGSGYISLARWRHSQNRAYQMERQPRCPIRCCCWTQSFLNQ